MCNLKVSSLFLSCFHVKEAVQRLAIAGQNTADSAAVSRKRNRQKPKVRAKARN